MKCPKCQMVQSDTLSNCKGCGLIFEKYREVEAKPAPLQYEVVERRVPWSGLILLLLAVCAGGFFLTREPRGRMERKPSEKSVALLNEPRVIAHLGRQSQSPGAQILSKACMDEALNGGLTEVQGRAMCYDDPEAKKQVQEANEEEERLLNFTEASEIARIELLVKAEATGSPDDYRVQLFLLPYDSKGISASTEGEVEVALSPEIPGHRTQKTSVQRNGFRVSQVKGKEGVRAWTQFSSMSVHVTPELRGKTITVIATFDGRISATASLEVNPGSIDEDEVGIPDEVE